MMAPFQCDICHFQNLKGRNPVPGRHQDELLLMCIRRVVLDSFWSRERSTVNSNRLEGAKFVELQEILGLKRRALPPQGPYPMEDTWGVNVACSLVLRSLDRGNYTNNIQFETMRKMRTFVSNYTHASRGGTGVAFLRSDNMSSRVTLAPTQLKWFQRFMQGSHKRMGDVWIPK